MKVSKFALLRAYLFPGVTNQSTSFTADVEAYIQEEVEPLEAAPGLERCDRHAGIVPRDDRAVDPFR